MQPLLHIAFGRLGWVALIKYETPPVARRMLGAMLTFAQASRPLAAAAMIVAALACGDAANDQSAGASTGSQGSQSSSSGGSFDLWVSVIAETEAGQAPAMVRLANDTDLILTLQVGGATFWQDAGPYGRTPDQLAVSATVADDVRLGYHESKSPQAPCVFLDLFGVGGDSSLMPGTLHRFRLTGDSVEALNANVETVGPAEPYLAVRVGHTASVVGLQSVALVIDDEPLTFAPSFSGLGDYRHVKAASAQLGEVRVQKQQSFTATLDVDLEGAHGFTVMVGPRMAAPFAEARLELAP